MSDVVDQESGQNENQGTDNGTDSGSSKQLTYEELQTELAKVRREAADRRVKNRDAETELAEFRKWKESQMNDLEKANSRVEELTKGRLEDARDIAKERFKLDDEDMEFIHGNTKEEILASAEKYSKRQGRDKGNENGGDGQNQASRNPNLFPGTRGEPVGRNANDHNALLREQLFGR